MSRDFASQHCYRAHRTLSKVLLVLWNDTCELQLSAVSCVYFYVVCVQICLLIACWAGGSNFNEKIWRLKMSFRWHPPKCCFSSFYCSLLHPAPSKNCIFSKTFHTFVRNLNIEASGCELVKDLVSFLLPCLILHHCHSTLLTLPTQS